MGPHERDAFWNANSVATNVGLTATALIASSTSSPVPWLCEFRFRDKNPRVRAAISVALDSSATFRDAYSRLVIRPRTKDCTRTTATFALSASAPVEVADAATPPPPFPFSSSFPTPAAPAAFSSTLTASHLHSARTSLNRVSNASAVATSANCTATSTER